MTRHLSIMVGVALVAFVPVIGLCWVMSVASWNETLAQVIGGIGGLVAGSIGILVADRLDP